MFRFDLENGRRFKYAGDLKKIKKIVCCDFRGNWINECKKKIFCKSAMNINYEMKWWKLFKIKIHKTNDKKKITLIYIEKKWYFIAIKNNTYKHYAFIGLIKRLNFFYVCHQINFKYENNKVFDVMRSIL